MSPTSPVMSIISPTSSVMSLISSIKLSCIVVSCSFIADIVLMGSVDVSYSDISVPMCCEDSPACSISEEIATEELLIEIEEKAVSWYSLVASIVALAGFVPPGITELIEEGNGVVREVLFGSSVDILCLVLEGGKRAELNDLRL